MIGELSTLGILKNVLFAPLSKTRTTTITAELPQARASSSVTLHDNHNVEIKTIFELSSAPSVVETDIYLFVPKSFELPTLGKEELIRDFRSRVRLALPVDGEQGAMALDSALKNLQENLQAICEVGSYEEPITDINHALCEPVLEAAKDLSAVIAEAVKHRTMEHSRKFLLSHTLLSIPKAAISGLEELAKNLEETAETMTRVRAAIGTQNEAAHTVLQLLDEYVSQLYVQYLSAIRTEFFNYPSARGTDGDLAYVKARIHVEELLDRLQENEAKHRRTFGIHAGDDDGDIGRERWLLRLSHLKKFFQSKTFIDITRYQSAKKISESTATIGTAVAAIVAATIEQFGRGAIADRAWQGLLLISFGVICYVLRDRLKDKAKVVFHQKALKFLPDFEQQLIAKDKRIGRVKEWFRFIGSKDRPMDVVTLRKSAALTEMEKRLPEDVFHCRKIQEVDATTLAESDRVTHSRSLYENTRICFARYMKHMDDAFKDLSDLDPNGRLILSRSHRVYYFYLCIKTISGPAETGLQTPWRSQAPRSATKTQTLLYRVVLDKNGVVRLEDVAAGG